MEWSDVAALDPLIADWLRAASGRALARQLDHVRYQMPPDGFVCAPPRHCRHAHVPLEAANDDPTVDKSFRTMRRIARSDVFDEEQDVAANAARLHRAIRENIEVMVEVCAYQLIHLDARRYRIARVYTITDVIPLEFDIYLTVNYTDAPLAEKSLPDN